MTALFILILAITNGFLLYKALGIPFPRWLVRLSAPALGIIITTIALLLTSLVFGLTAITIIATTAFLTICLLFCQKYSPSDKKSASLKLERPFIFLLLLTLPLIIYVFLFKVLGPMGNNLVTGGGGLYADTALHSAYTMSMVAQGVPPMNPLFAGIALVYPFLVNLFSGALVITGLHLRFAFALPQITFFVAFVSLYYAVARKFTSSRGATFALLIFFLGWGLGFFHYFNDGLHTGIWEVTREYTNSLDIFNMHNVLTGLIFPERSFLPGLVIGLFITFLLLEIVSPTKHLPLKRHYLLIGVLLGFLPLWHTHTFLFFGGAIGLWLLPQVFKKKHISPLVLVYVPALIIVTPILFWMTQQITHTSFISYRVGWMNFGNSNPLMFWLQNTGMILPLTLIGIGILAKDKRWFFLPAGVVFCIANLIQFQPWDWDNIKLFSWVLLFLTIPVGHVLVVAFEKHWLFKPVALVILFSLIGSGMLSLTYQLTQTYTLYDGEGIEMAEWVKQNTAPTDVFMIDPWPNHPLPGLTGRSAYVGYPGQLWVHGIDYQARDAQTKRALAGNVSVLGQTDVPIDYVIGDVEKPFNNPLLQVVFVNKRFIIYRVLKITL